MRREQWLRIDGKGGLPLGQMPISRVCDLDRSVGLRARGRPSLLSRYLQQCSPNFRCYGLPAQFIDYVTRARRENFDGGASAGAVEKVQVLNIRLRLVVLASMTVEPSRPYRAVQRKRGVDGSWHFWWPEPPPHPVPKGETFWGSDR
jgi:hypothetical protein